MGKLRSIGGTPVAEGVRLESGTATVFAVRNEKKDIAVRIRREPRALLRAGMKIPLVRGVVRLFRDLIRFFDGISESAELEPQRIVRGNAAERWIARVLHVHPQTIVAWITAMLVSVIAAICLWAAPQGAELFLRQYFDMTRAAVNAVAAIVRIFGALTFIGLTSQLRVVRRLNMYRGAINQALNCYEAREEISVENAAEYPIIARRSECAYLLIVLIVSMALFPLLPPDGILMGALQRIGIILGVAAIVNEPIHAMECAEMTLPVRIIRAPYNLLQYMTCANAHPQMLEVAVCAFNAVLGKITEESENDHL